MLLNLSLLIDRRVGLHGMHQAFEPKRAPSIPT
jgi:hypothetical protein